MRQGVGNGNESTHATGGGEMALAELRTVLVRALQGGLMGTGPEVAAAVERRYSDVIEMLNQLVAEGVAVKGPRRTGKLGRPSVVYQIGRV